MPCRSRTRCSLRCRFAGCCCMQVGPVADGLVKRGWPLTRVRKLAQGLAFVVPAACMLACGVLTPTSTAVANVPLLVTLLSVGFAFGAWSRAGLYCNHQVRLVAGGFPWWSRDAESAQLGPSSYCSNRLRWQWDAECQAATVQAASGMLAGLWQGMSAGDCGTCGSRLTACVCSAALCCAVSAVCRTCRPSMPARCWASQTQQVPSLVCWG
jgi:hypothetical protein